MKHARILTLAAFAAVVTLAAQPLAAQQRPQQAAPKTAARRTASRKAESQAELRAAAKISESQAREIARKQVPGGTVQEGELEREEGKVVYSYDIKVPGKSGVEEVWVDAINGTVVKHEHETPAKERKEKKAEAKKGKGGTER